MKLININESGDNIDEVDLYINDVTPHRVSLSLKEVLKRAYIETLSDEEKVKKMLKETKNLRMDLLVEDMVYLGEPEEGDSEDEERHGLLAIKTVAKVDDLYFELCNGMAFNLDVKGGELNPIFMALVKIKYRL